MGIGDNIKDTINQSNIFTGTIIGHEDFMAKKLVCIINGEPRVGKSTLVKWASCIVHTVEFSTIDPIKDILDGYVDFNNKDPKLRKLLSDFKLSMIAYNDYPFECTKRRILDYSRLNDKESIMFIHIREPEEIKKTVDYIHTSFEDLACTTLLIHNGERRSDEYMNSADANVYYYDYDLYFTNVKGDKIEAINTWLKFVRDSLQPKMTNYMYKMLNDPEVFKPL